MNYQNETLPEGAVKAGSTPSMTEETVVPGILKKHLAPKGKFGYLVVEEGSLQFVWEDDEDNVLDADPKMMRIMFWMPTRSIRLSFSRSDITMYR